VNLPRGQHGSWLTVVAATAVWLGGTSPAVGQSKLTRGNEAAARVRFDRGSKLYEAGRFLDAAREFEAGYESAPRPLFLLNIGHSYRRAQQLRKAKTAYEKLLQTDPTTPQRSMVEDLIRTIDDALIAQDLDMTIPGKTGPALVPLTGNSRRLAARDPVSRARSTLAVTTPVTTATRPPPSPESTWLRSPWLWGIVAGVVTAGVAGTVFALTRGLSCPADSCWKEF
jgi:hypothetical protein